MVALHEISKNQTRRRRRLRKKVALPEIRPSILDPCLENEPWIDPCPCCADTLCLYLHNYPIALIAGSPLDGNSLSMRLSQLRHRNPRIF